MRTAKVPLNVGDRAGRITIIGPIKMIGKRSFSMARCDCGKEWLVERSAIRYGRTKSCGCLGAEKRRHSRLSHGMSRTSEYAAWCTLIQRCTSKAGRAASYYANRGISVCERWHKFENFLADMGSRPEGMSIERIDNDGNYEPANCRWANQKEQMRNMRRNGTVILDGKAMCATDAARHLGIPVGRIFCRVSKYSVTHQQALDHILGRE